MPDCERKSTVKLGDHPTAINLDYPGSSSDTKANQVRILSNLVIGVLRAVLQGPTSLIGQSEHFLLAIQDSSANLLRDRQCVLPHSPSLEEFQVTKYRRVDQAA